LNEIQILQLTRLIADGLTAGQACEAVGVTQSALTRRLIEARRAAKGATEEQRLKQRYYGLLKAYESAQEQRAKTLRRQRGNPQEKKMALERHPLIHRDLMTFPQDERKKLLDHIRHGSDVAHALEAVRVHASVAGMWLQRGLDAFVNGLEDDESVAYIGFYLDIGQAKGTASTDASERVFAGTPIAYLLYGSGRETETSPGWSKNPRVTRQAEKPPIKIVTEWGTSTNQTAVVSGKLQPFKVEVPPDSDYQPPDRTDWPSEDEG